MDPADPLYLNTASKGNLCSTPSLDAAFVPNPAAVRKDLSSNAPSFPLPPLPSDVLNGKGKRTVRRSGPAGVQWSPSKERQLARLYEMTDVRTEDIPVVMRSNHLQFKYVPLRHELGSLAIV